MANLHMTDHMPMKLEKHCTYRIERRWLIPNQSPFGRSLSVQCLNSTYGSKILMKVLEVVM